MDPHPCQVCVVGDWSSSYRTFRVSFAIYCIVIVMISRRVSSAFMNGNKGTIITHADQRDGTVESSLCFIKKRLISSWGSIGVRVFCSPEGDSFTNATSIV